VCFIAVGAICRNGLDQLKRMPATADKLQTEPEALILGRPLDVIYDEDLARSFARFELQSKLLLKCRKY
jgi:hypothetical protein